MHAQFESVHPFTDGNGRIGRALINAVLRRRGLTSRTIAPLASAMVANRQRYFDLVNNYRKGVSTSVPLVGPAFWAFPPRQVGLSHVQAGR